MHSLLRIQFAIIKLEIKGKVVHQKNKFQMAAKKKAKKVKKVAKKTKKVAKKKKATKKRK